MEDPDFREGFASRFGGMFLGLKGGVEVAENVFGGLIDFVAKPAIAMHLLYVEVDIAAW